jgi:hypothetical protein
MISKSLSTSEKFAALVTGAGPLAEFCQTLFPLLVPHSDDFGRLQGDPFTVKHVCHPSSPRSLTEFADALRYLHSVDLIIWYTVEGKRYIQIQQFDPHQQGLHKRTRSNFPLVPGNSGKFPEIPGNSGPREENGREEKRTEEKYPPTPLRGGRGRRRRTAETPGGTTCPHTPRCRTTDACIARTLGAKVGK